MPAVWADQQSVRSEQQQTVIKGSTSNNNQHFLIYDDVVDASQASCRLQGRRKEGLSDSDPPTRLDPISTTYDFIKEFIFPGIFGVLYKAPQYGIMENNRDHSGSGRESRVAAFCAEPQRDIKEKKGGKFFFEFPQQSRLRTGLAFAAVPLPGLEGFGGRSFKVLFRFPLRPLHCQHLTNDIYTCCCSATFHDTTRPTPCCLPEITRRCLV